MLHNHHIIPKHAGGGNESENLILLTVEEHALAHKKLWETYGKEEDRIAWKMLSGQIGLEEARKAALKIAMQRPEVRAKISASKKGIPRPLSVRLAIIKSNKARTGWKHTDASKMKMCGIKKGRWIKGQIPWNKGIPHSAETRAKIRAVRWGKT